MRSRACMCDASTTCLKTTSTSFPDETVCSRQPQILPTEVCLQILPTNCKVTPYMSQARAPRIPAAHSLTTKATGPPSSPNLSFPKCLYSCTAALQPTPVSYSITSMTSVRSQSCHCMQTSNSSYLFPMLHACVHRDFREALKKGMRVPISYCSAGIPLFIHIRLR